jgi:hypothetical protein
MVYNIFAIYSFAHEQHYMLALFARQLASSLPPLIEVKFNYKQMDGKSVIYEYLFN